MSKYIFKELAYLEGETAKELLHYSRSNNNEDIIDIAIEISETYDSTFESEYNNIISDEKAESLIIGNNTPSNNALLVAVFKNRMAEFENGSNDESISYHTTKPAEGEYDRSVQIGNILLTWHSESMDWIRAEYVTEDPIGSIEIVLIYELLNDLEYWLDKPKFSECVGGILNIALLFFMSKDFKLTVNKKYKDVVDTDSLRNLLSTFMNRVIGIDRRNSNILNGLDSKEIILEMKKYIQDNYGYSHFYFNK